MATSPSPSRVTRVQEKDELRGLNQRLASYISHVKQMKDENSKLQAEVTTAKEVTIKEVDSIKDMYETELNDARRLLDETAKEKARQQIAASKHASDAEELKIKLTDEATRRQRAENDLESSERALTTKESTVQAALKDKQRAVAQKTDALRELEDLKKALDQAKSALETETLARVDLENSNQSLREELAFKQQLHEQELEELKARIRSINTMTVTLESKLGEEYDDRLARAIDDLRESFENETHQYKDDLDKNYQDKVDNLQNRLDRETDAVDGLSKDINELNKENTDLNGQIHDLENKIAAKDDRIKELEGVLGRERDRNARDTDRLRKELKNTRDDLEAKIQEYEDLLDTKLHLDMELATYKKLMDEEEDRLKLSPKFKSSGPEQGGIPEAERPRVEETSPTSTTTIDAEGAVQISLADAGGNYVKVSNVGDVDVKMASWRIERTVDDKVFKYKFPARYILRATSTVTIWSNNGTHAAKPPTDLLFKQSNTWGKAQESFTNLLDPSGKLVSKVVTHAGGEPQHSKDESDGFSASEPSSVENSSSRPVPAAKRKRLNPEESVGSPSRCTIS
ncbi:lamin-B1-like [Corticium candelabrum]|uniref:lamin-B1-like n=1 Tax=Corticium candelabrum TaxID=121492 RepID=UPI002E26E578|nr:lamin-B1-like [Corticium candelabrum]